MADGRKQQGIDAVKLVYPPLASEGDLVSSMVSLRTLRLIRERSVGAVTDDGVDEVMPP